MRYEYPASVIQDKDGTCVVTFPDIPGLTVRASTRRDAHRKAQIALSAALAKHILNRTECPLPSVSRKKHVKIPVQMLTAAKLALTKRMRKSHLSNVALAKRLGVTEAVVRRLVNPEHHSKLSGLQEALAILEVKLVVDVSED